MSKAQKRTRAKKERVYDPMAPWMSWWFITYNSNRTDERLIPAINAAFDFIVTHIDRYIRERSSPTVRLISVQEGGRTFERGDRYHRIHMHTNLRVYSYGLSDLDYKHMSHDMSTIIRQYFPQYTQGYLNGRIIENGNTLFKIENYLKKAPIRHYST